MIKPIILFAIGLIFLIKGGDWFVEGAVSVAKKFNIPELIIGATVVSLGTTLPELMVSVNSALGGHGEMSYGNAIGSVICNTSLIAALSIAIKPSELKRKNLVVPAVFFFVSAIFYAFNAYVYGVFTRRCGIILLMILAAYIFTIISLKEVNEDAEDEAGKETGLWGSIFLLVAGAVVIALGADFLVDNGIIIAKALGVAESVIAITFVALGTSLPELATAITSLRKGHGLISLGNIIGANLLNIVLVSATSITLAPFGIPQTKKIMGTDMSLAVELPVMFLVSLVLIVPAMISGKTKRWQGITMLLIYGVFCVIQFA